MKSPQLLTCSLFVNMMFGYIAATSRWYIRGNSSSIGSSFNLISCKLKDRVKRKIAGDFACLTG